MDDIQSLIFELRFGAENGADAELLERAADKIQELVADHGDEDEMTEYWMKKNKWIRCRERLPEDGKTVLCAIYHTDLIVAHEGETIKEAAARCQAEAANHPYMVIGCYYDGEGWSDDVFGAPMVCDPSYWMEIPPMPHLPDAPETVRTRTRDLEAPER